MMIPNDNLVGLNRCVNVKEDKSLFQIHLLDANTSAHVSLARTQLHDHTQLQGRLAGKWSS